MRRCGRSVGLVAVVTSSHSRTPHSHANRGSSRGHTDRPDGRGVPPGREPQHADARRRAPAVREARGRGPRLRPRDVRVDARRRRDRAAVPQAPAPLARDRRPAGLGRGRAVRHRAPRPAQRAAQAGPDPRAPRPERPPARHPAGLGAAAVGGARHRGAARRPGGALHEDPPRARRRHLGDAAAAERAQPRPGPARHAAAVGRPHPRGTEPATRREPTPALAEIPTHAMRSGARHHRRGRRHAGRADQDAHARACATRPRRSRSTRRARSSTSRSPAPDGSPPRTGRSSGCARSARRPAPRSTTSCSRCAAAPYAATSSSSTRCPDAPLVAMVPVGLKAKESHVASTEGGNAVGVGDVPARHRPRRTRPTG